MSSRQTSLFDSAPPDWEADASALRRVAEVVLAKGPDRVFDYEVPDAFCSDDHPERLLTPGRRVRVPFGRGNREVVGYCVALATKSVDPHAIKPLAGVLDGAALLSSSMLELTRWMADYYLCPWGQVLDAVVPAGVRSRAGTREVRLLRVPTDVRDNLAGLKLRSKQQAAALRLLADSEHPLPASIVAKRAGCTTGPVRQLLRQGLVEEVVQRVASTEPAEPVSPRQEPLVLNDDQQAALQAILAALESGDAARLLLHGVTGSGKTEVYLQAIERVVSYGRQAIVLVPEISLTPQTVRRFRSRFDRVAVLHSHLTEAERGHYWNRIARGEVQVVVGARSAVFAPTPQLGLIVIDEEHENTFKQDVAPRYHARDVAWQRAQAEGVPLLLGSATPALESWQRAAEGEMQLLSLPRRVLDRSMPDVLVVDLRDRAHTRTSRGAISRPLHQAMHAALRDSGQVILLLNRRGFSTHIQCPGCGFVLRCPHCEMSLTFHRQTNRTICHLCDHEEPPPTACPDCTSSSIRYGGLGTQKLEDEVRARFPEHVCARMDTDSTRRRGSHEDFLGRFRAGEIDILLGTQMIAKGLDFPNVTLVGVINADTALHLVDFRAAERTFQLVAQVAGRTGRGAKGGRVLVQTFEPDHPAIVAAARHDFQAFVAAELADRRSQRYPPFGFLARIVVRSQQEGRASDTATMLGERLRSGEMATKLRILGPAPAPMMRLRGEHRFHLQLHGPNAGMLQAHLRETLANLRVPKGVLWTVDIDPWDMQ
ncbi:primosomal protein N' [Pirellulales bacterium]|nr:primosomal protein N' [Pirellulales bacterium]